MILAAEGSGVDELRSLAQRPGTTLAEWKPLPLDRTIKPREIGHYEEGMDLWLVIAFGVVWIVVVILMDHVRILLDGEGIVRAPWPWN